MPPDCRPAYCSDPAFLEAIPVQRSFLQHLLYEYKQNNNKAWWIPGKSLQLGDELNQAHFSGLQGGVGKFL